MEKIKLVTDSTGSLSKEEEEIFDTISLPLYITLEDKTYKEGEILREDFFNYLEKTSKLPKTSQVSTGDFINVFEKLLKDGYKILGAFISSGLSGTVNSARVARETLKSDDILIVDSLVSGQGLFFILEKAASLIKGGFSFSFIKDELEKFKRKIKMFFLLDNLKFLYMGGRLSGAQRFLGEILQIKPILTPINGLIEVFEKQLTWQKAKERIVSIVEEGVKKQRIERLGVFFGTNKDEAEDFKKGLSKIYDGNIHLSPLSVVLGVYSGAKMLGVTIVES